MLRVNCTKKDVDLAIEQSFSWLTAIPKVKREDPTIPIKLEIEALESKLSQMEADYLESPSSVIAKALGAVEQELSGKRVELASISTEHIKDDFIMTEPPETLEEQRQWLNRSYESVMVYKIGRGDSLISFYSKVGVPTHIRVKRGKILQQSRLYHEPNAENQLMDVNQFSLFVADGRLDEWLDKGTALDSHDDKDSLDVEFYNTEDFI